MYSIKRYLLISIIYFLVSACSDGGGDTNSIDSAVASCIDRGVAYFKEIGSYPSLATEPNKGRSAAEVASERCSRTTTAF
jgi:hypothetical protein